MAIGTKEAVAILQKFMCVLLHLPNEDGKKNNVIMIGPKR